MSVSSFLRKGVRYLRNLLIVLVLLSLLFALSLYIFEKKWGEFAVRQSIEMLNEQLEAPISTSNIEFTFFANFPHASLRLRDVVIPSAHQEVFGSRDTLLVAKSLFIVLNPLDLLDKKIRVKSFAIEKGYLSLKHSRNGLKNYDLLKKSQDSTESMNSSFLLEVQALELNEMVVEFLDARTLVTAKMVLPTLASEFQLQKGSFQLRVRTHGWLESVRQGDFIYAQKQHFSLKSSCSIEDEMIRTERTELQLDRNRLAVSGYWQPKKNDIQLNVTGTNLDIRTLLAFASQYKWQLPNTVEVSGALNANLTIASDIAKTSNLQLNMSVYGEDLTLSIAEQNYKLKVFQASFSNGSEASRRSTMFEIAQCTIQKKSSTFSGQFRLSNLEHPMIYTLFDFVFSENEVVLPFMQPYIGDYKSLRGKVEMAAAFKNLDTLSFESIRNPKLRAELDFDVNTLKANPYQLFTELSGAATLVDEDLVKGAVRGKWNGVEFDLGLNVKHFLTLFRKGIPPQWTLNARLAHYDLPRDGVPVWNQEDTLATSPKDSVDELQRTWDRVGTIRGDLALYKCLYRGALIDSLQSSFYFAKDRMQLNLQQVKLLGGRAQGEVFFQNISPRESTLQAKLNTERLDLKELFLRCDDFGLKSFGHENLSGLLSGSLSMNLPLTNGKPDLPNLRLNTKLVVHNGELTEMKGLETLATFIKLEELKQIKFSTLENEITIADQKVIIPQMRVRSSALFLKVQGEQYFNSRFQYRLQLSLSDLLFNRWRAKGRELEEHVYEEEGNSGGSLYILLEGDSTNMRVSFDRRALADRYQQRVRQEKEELKALFNEEFQWGKDSMQEGSKGTTSPTKRYTIEWEERDTIKRNDSVKAKSKVVTPTKRKDPPAVVWEDD